MVIAGEFTSVNADINNPRLRNRIGRLSENGVLDEIFRPSPTGVVSQYGPSGIVRALAIDTNGKYLIGGDFTTYSVPGQDSEGNPQPLSRGPRIARIGGL